MNFFVRFLTTRLFRKGRTTTILNFSVQHISQHNIATRSVLFSVRDGQIYMIGAILVPILTVTILTLTLTWTLILNLRLTLTLLIQNTNLNLNANPNNSNHNHTPRMESTLEQIQLSVLGDRKYNLRSSSGIYNNKTFRSQHHSESLPGAKVPDVELSLPGTSFP